jgi:hypothetical protein
VVSDPKAPARVPHIAGDKLVPALRTRPQRSLLSRGHGNAIASDSNSNGKRKETQPAASLQVKENPRQSESAGHLRFLFRSSPSLRL